MSIVLFVLLFSMYLVHIFCLFLYCCSTSKSSFISRCTVSLGRKYAAVIFSYLKDRKLYDLFVYYCLIYYYCMFYASVEDVQDVQTSTRSADHKNSAHGPVNQQKLL